MVCKFCDELAVCWWGHVVFSVVALLCFAACDAEVSGAFGAVCAGVVLEDVSAAAWALLDGLCPAWASWFGVDDFVGGYFECCVECVVDAVECLLGLCECLADGALFGGVGGEALAGGCVACGVADVVGVVVVVVACGECVLLLLLDVFEDVGGLCDESLGVLVEVVCLLLGCHGFLVSWVGLSDIGGLSWG